MEGLIASMISSIIALVIVVGVGVPLVAYFGYHLARLIIYFIKQYKEDRQNWG